MSVFATLRRRRDRAKGGASKGTVLVAESKSEPLFNSTPNLHKINYSAKSLPVSAHRKNKDATVFQEDSEDVIFEDEVERYEGFENRRSSSATEEATRMQGGKLSYGRNKGSSGSLRQFASMMSMFGSLKRSKSSRKMAYGSTQNIVDGKRSEASAEFMRDRTTGKSPEAEMNASKSSSLNSSHTTNSADCICEGVPAREKFGNTEPGVRSSSSSDDDESRRSSGVDKMTERTDSVGTESDLEYVTTKSAEELKRTKIMIQGIKKFNMGPKKGIEFLVEHHILQHTPDDVAKFLKFGEGLSKTAIGTYLGEHINFNEEVLQAFLDLHKFKDLILVQALRDFLWSFRLPGESQKIDRMMEAFAKRYCQSNPGIFSSTDTCYLLSYSIIMLNTTLHNPSVKDKPSVEQFIQMNRDVDCGKSLNRTFLVHLYNSILAEPFKIPPEDANDLVLTFFNPNIEGWLWKQGGYKTWKRRWFILSNNCLYYFKFTTDKNPRGIIPLENVNAKEVSTSKSNELFPFILFKKSSSLPSDVIKTCKTLSNGSTVLSQYVRITLASINHEDRRKWVQSINQNNSDSDFYDVLTLKKRNLEAMRQPQTKGVPPPTPKETPKIRKSLISQPSTAPGFEYKDKIPAGLIVPAGSDKDPNNYFKKHAVFSSTASISSGSAVEQDSSYGSYSDISRCRSESRILDYSHDNSFSSINNDTNSLGSRGNLGLDEKESFSRGFTSPERKKHQPQISPGGAPQDTKYDLPKKLSIIEESQNHPSSSSSSSSANLLNQDSRSNPICLGYRKLSDADCESSTGTSAFRSDSANCDISQTLDNPTDDSTKEEDIPCNNSMNDEDEIDELCSSIQKLEDYNDHVLGSVKLRYCRSGSLESDV